MSDLVGNPENRFSCGVAYLTVTECSMHLPLLLFQLPPTLNPNPRRRIIERFKRALFSPQSSSFNLKGELHKVIFYLFCFLLLNLDGMNMITKR